MRLHILPLVLACGCATDVASKGDVRALEEQLASLKKENTKLLSRVDALERDRQVMAPAVASPQPAPVAAPSLATSPPSLAVVKLMPKPSPPPLDVATPVQEPDPALFEQLDAKDAPGAAAAQSGAADQEYRTALEALRTGNVSGAIERLKRFADAYPRHNKADDALYYAALGELGRGELARAAVLLEQVVARYPAGDVVQDAMLKLGEVRVRLRQPAEARAAYAQLVQSFPGTAAAVQAQARLSSLPRNP
jgi:tol-pal system protein YbgF